MQIHKKTDYIMANALFKEEWFKIISSSNYSDDDRKNMAWAVLEYLINGEEEEVNDMCIYYEKRIREMSKNIKRDAELRRRRAEAARKRREERKKNAQAKINRPCRSKQHIYEQHPAMYLFDGFASYMISTAYTAGRKVITEKYGAIDFDKAIKLFRKNIMERNQLNSLQRFHVFRDMFTRFLAEKPRGIAVA